MKKLTIPIVMGLLCLSFWARGQEVIRGRVINTKGQPIVGATISILNSKKSFITDSLGVFNIVSNNKVTHVEISYVGLISKFLKLEDSSDITDVVLEEKDNHLDEVVIMAYGTTTKRLNIGSISKVTSEEIARQPVTNPLLTLSGRVPGLLITQSSGVPGAGVSVKIRGTNSLINGSEPLYIIDGIPFDAGNMPLNMLNNAAGGNMSAFDLVNSNDIESVEVLKDANATAIYGSRGANGVILITTKKSKAQKIKSTLNIYSGFGDVAKPVKFLSTEEYITMREEAFSNDNKIPTVGLAPDLKAWERTYVDFPKLLIGGTAATNNIQFQTVGGNDTNSFLFGLGYSSETTVFPTDLGNDKLNFRLNYSYREPNDKFNLVLSTGYFNNINRLTTTDLTRYINTVPLFKLYDSKGNLNWEEGGISYSSLGLRDANPMAYLRKEYKGSYNSINNNFQFNIKLLPDFFIQSRIGYNTIVGEELRKTPNSAIDKYSGEVASSSLGNSRQTNLIVEPQLEYKVNLLGEFKFLLGGTWQNRKVQGTIINSTNFTNDLMLGNPQAAGLNQVSSRDNMYKYEGVYGSVSYNKGNTYLINLNVRRDGSSRFSPENRFDTFWSLGAAWIISQNKSFLSSFDILSFLKLRGSIGVLGNDQIGDYKYLDSWTTGSGTYIGSTVLNPTSLYNPNLRWERTLKQEMAIELGFFDNSLFINSALYRNKSSNQLVNYMLPSQTGFNSILQNRDAVIENKGLEFDVTYNFKAGRNINWKIGYNISFQENKLLSFPNLESSPYANTLIIGKSLQSVRLYEYKGVDPKTGYYTMNDINNDGKLDIQDRVSYLDLNPKYFGGLSSSLNWKSINVDIFLEFRNQIGRDYKLDLISTIPGVSLYNQPKYVLERWRSVGDEATIQKFVTGNSTTYNQQNFSNSDGAYSDASFLRFKNISVSYSLPQKFIHKVGLKSAHIFAQGQNLFTLTKFKGGDPENQGILSLPPLRVISFGANFNL